MVKSAGRATGNFLHSPGVHNGGFFKGLEFCTSEKLDIG